MTETVGSALEKRENGPRQMIADYRADFATVLPTQIKPDTWVRLAQGLLRRDADLARIAQKNPGSLMQALLECARLGHEPGTDRFYLVPMGSEIEGWEGYKGVIQRILRSGKVSNVKAEIVCRGDHFEYEPDTMTKPIHRADWFGDRGDVIGSYAYAEMADGTVSKVAIADQGYISRVRAMQRNNKNASSPWMKWYESMVLKCAVNRLEPFVDTSSEDLRQPIKAESVVDQRPTVPAIAPAPKPVKHLGSEWTEAPAEQVYDGEIVDEHDRYLPGDPDLTGGE